MDLRVKASPSKHLLVRPCGQANYYPAPTVNAARVRLYMCEAGAPITQAQFVGEYAIDELVEIPYNPATDRNLVFYAVAISATGVPDFTDLRDAAQIGLLYRREQDAPIVTQAGAATQFAVTLDITNFSPYAKRRRIRIADNEAMTGAVSLVTTRAGATFGRAAIISRASTATNAQTIYVRVSHSSSDAGNTWGAESDILTLTFANSTGTGGTIGGGDPYGRDQYDYIY